MQFVDFDRAETAEAWRQELVSAVVSNNDSEMADRIVSAPVAPRGVKRPETILEDDLQRQGKNAVKRHQNQRDEWGNAREECDRLRAVAKAAGAPMPTMFHPYRTCLERFQQYEQFHEEMTTKRSAENKVPWTDAVAAEADRLYSASLQRPNLAIPNAVSEAWGARMARDHVTVRPEGVSHRDAVSASALRYCAPDP